MNRILLLALLVFAAAACSSDDDGTTQQGPTIDGDAAVITLVPQVRQSGEDNTRSAVLGNTFVAGDNVGYILMGSASAIKNAGLPHLPGYGNVRAAGARVAPPPNDGVTPNYADTWTYYVNNLYMGMRLAGYPSYGNLDIYGYYPYNESVDYTNKNAIPFCIGELNAGVAESTEQRATIDYMWADPKIDYDITPLAATPVTMQFHHLMTFIEFRIRKMYYGPALTVKWIEFQITGNGRQFLTKGTYDAATGAMTGTETTDKIVVEYNKTLGNGSSTSGWINMQMIMPELTCLSDNSDDATVSAKFILEDHDDNWDFFDGGTYTFNLSQIVNPGGDKGILAGKKYKVDIDVSNVVKFSGVPKLVDRWENGSTIDPETGEDTGIIEI